MFLTNGPAGGAGGQSADNGNGFGGNSGGYGAGNGYAGGGGGFGGGNNVCFNCGKAGHFARDCWSRRTGRGFSTNYVDPELEEIKEQHRQARKERLELEERKRLEEERKAREEEDVRRNADFARKAEEFKLQLRAELVEEWRKKDSEAKKALKRMKQASKSATTRRQRKKGRNFGKTARKIASPETSDDSDPESGDSDTSDIQSTSASSDDSHKRRDKIRKGKKRVGGRSAAKKGKPRKLPVESPPRVYEQGECSKPRKEEFLRKNEVVDDRKEGETEPKTPLLAGYKGLAAECSQKGLIEYCILAHRIYSAKKANTLKKLCERKGIKYTGKPDAVEILARHQVHLAYDGFDEGLRSDTVAKKAAGEGTPILDTAKGKGVVETVASRPSRVILRKFGLDKYTMIPLKHSGKDDDYAFERFLIADLCPSLNSREFGKEGKPMRRRGRRGRRERIGRAGTAQVQRIVTFMFQNSRCTSLLLWLTQHEGRGCWNLVFSGGVVWTDRWRNVVRRYGSTILETEGKKSTLREAKKVLEQGGSVRLVRVVRTRTATEKNKTWLIGLLRKPRPTSQLANLPSSRLIGLYRTARLFAEKQTRLRLRTSIDRAIAQKVGFSVRRRINIKLPYDSRLRKSAVREATEGLINNRVSDLVVAKFLMTRIRIIWIKNKNVWELLHNQRVYANDEHYRCPCKGSTLDKLDGHVLTRFSKTKVPQFVANSRNVTRPARACQTPTIIRAILDAMKHIRGSGSMQVTITSPWEDRKPLTGAWADEEVVFWALRFEGLVLVPIDRNQGDTTVICPVLYRHAFGKSFSWNTNYECVGTVETEASLLKACKADFTARGLGKIGGWRPDGLGELAERLAAASQQLRAAGCTHAEGRCYDIKEMFSRIPHSVVIQAVRQLLRKYEDDGCTQIKVSMRGKLVVISKNRRRTEGYVSITLRQILVGVEYDQEHSLVKCGEKVMKQIFGIPMGKSTSLILASVTCAMAEMQFLNQLGAERRLVCGWRIMDDITVIAGIDGETASWLFPGGFFKAFEDIYDENLEVICKDDCGLTWEFVSGSMYIRGSPVQLHYVPCTKNTDSLHSDNSQVFQTMQDYNSYSRKAVKKVVLTMKLRRLWDQTTSKQLVLGAVGFAICEANLRGYPPEASLGALASLARAAPDRALQVLLTALRFAAFR
ncbi:hypothetical protein CBR_g26299 [Chara braunii]|uniref:CCHC-type domain-containing protein n=1 Tax=Chara braunii TaxID=69332 RepID=A0A388L7L2_CHABU|nr:hypothetical protein CBR_g26299 [Chara braunii]|eukprot:GBG78268.1 hypothetical protein CBR_g26299 [Chara braunii]